MPEDSSSIQMLVIFSNTTYWEHLVWKDAAPLCSVPLGGEKLDLLVQDSVRTQMSPMVLSSAFAELTLLKVKASVAFSFRFTPIFLHVVKYSPNSCTAVNFLFVCF